MLATSGEQVIGWLKALRQIIDDERGEGPDFIRPVHLVTLALALKEAKATRLGMSRLEEYAAKMGLWEAIGLECPHLVDKLPTNNLYSPIRPLRERCDIDVCADEINSVIVANTPSKNDSAWIALTELLGNCFAHSRVCDGLYGLVCSQVWPNSERAQIAIADSGVGIRASLEESEDLRERLGSENACKLAAEYGISSKLGKGHAGYGLTLSRDLIQQNGGSFVIVSANEAYAFNRGKEKTWSGLNNLFSGTVVVFEWVTSKALDSEAVYSAWPSSGGNDEDIF